MTIMLKIPVDGPVEKVELSTLSELQSAVNGMIECPSILDFADGGTEQVDLDLIINEDGKFDGSEYNPRASILWGQYQHGDPIMGDVLVAKPDNATGEYVDLTFDDVVLVLRLLGDRMREAMLR